MIHVLVDALTLSKWRQLRFICLKFLIRVLGAISIATVKVQ